MLENIGSLREVKFVSIEGGHYLRGDLIQLVELLVLVIEALIAKNHKEHFWESVLSCSDIVLNFFLHAIQIGLVLKFDPIWLLDSDAKLDTGLSERLKDVVCGVIVVATFPFGALIDHDPLISEQIDTLLDRQFAKYTLIDVNDLILLENLR